MEIVPIMSTINFCSCWTEVVDENCSHHGNNFDGLWSQELVTIMVTSWQTVRFVTIYMALAKMCPNLGRIFNTIIFLLPDKLSGICCLKNYSQVGNNFLAHFRSIGAEVNVKSLANLARLFWLTLSQLATKSIGLSKTFSTWDGFCEVIILAKLARILPIKEPLHNKKPFGTPFCSKYYNIFLRHFSGA